MKYDDATWHSGGEGFAEELSDEAGGTHIGMYFAWCVMNNLTSEEILGDCDQEIQALKNRHVSPGEHFMNCYDGQLCDDMLNDEGNAFTKLYYDTVGRGYLDQYARTFATLDPSFTTYHVPDSWETYEKIAPIIEERYKAWKSQVV